MSESITHGGGIGIRRGKTPIVPDARAARQSSEKAVQPRRDLKLAPRRDGAQA